MAGRFTHEQLSPTVFKTVEDDPYKQYPFMYTILTKTRCFVIDTGCDSDNYRAYIDTHINTAKLPYTVINTHVHFDHIGGNHRFVPGQGGCEALCMSNANRTFTENYELTSLASAHSTRVQPFVVSRWLDDGELIPLEVGDEAAAVSPQNALRVLHTPGHTGDSLALYYAKERRLFLGDSFYPFAAVHLDCLGSDVGAFRSTLDKLQKFIREQMAGGSSVGGASADSGGADAAVAVADVVPPVAGSSVAGPSEEVSMFLSVVGLDYDTARKQFHPETLISVAGGVEAAVNMFFTSPDDVAQLAPVKPPNHTATSAAPAPAAIDAGCNIVLSCGHVEANLPATALDEVQGTMAAIDAGCANFNAHDDQYGEYQAGNYTFIMAQRK